jgi:hypothetical protein
MYILDKLPRSLAIGSVPPLTDDRSEWWTQWHFKDDEQWIPQEPCQDPPTDGFDPFNNYLPAIGTS